MMPSESGLQDQLRRMKARKEQRSSVQWSRNKWEAPIFARLHAETVRDHRGC